MYRVIKVSVKGMEKNVTVEASKRDDLTFLHVDSQKESGHRHENVNIKVFK